jgi:hypothetical protein
MSPPRFRLQLLGPVRLLTPEGDDAGLSLTKSLALLVYVALAPSPPPRDDLAALLWPRSTPSRARGSLRQALFQLRQILGEPLFDSDDPVTLHEGRLDVDVHDFRQHLAEGELLAALGLWQGAPLEGLQLQDAPGFERWAEGVRRDLESRFGTELALEGARHRNDGRLEEAFPWFRRALDVQPDLLARHIDLADTLLEARSFEEAGVTLRRARRRFEGDPAAHGELQALESRIDALRRGLPLVGVDAGAGLRLEFTGRTEEFSLLARRWRQARDGASGIALVVGDAGIGKTRLAREVALLADSEGGRVVQIKAEDSEHPIQWGLLSELVAQLRRLSGASGISPASERLLGTLAPSLPGRSGASWRAEGTPPSPSLPMRPTAALADALQDLISAVSDDAPLLLIVDDLQWADAESRSVLARVATRLEDTPVLLVATSRDSPGEGSPRMRKTLALLADAPGGTPIQLSPLPGSEVRRLLRRTLQPAGDGDAANLIDRLVRTSRGNPLFVVELLKALQDQGIIKDEDEDGGTWRLDLDEVPDDLPLPESLRELIDRQLADLTQEASLVAAHLARAGQPVAPRTLEGRTGLNPSSLTQGIGELSRRRMVQWDGSDRLTFAHDELRSAVARRFQLHVGLTTGGGTHWSLFRTAVVISFGVLLLGAATYLVTGGTFTSAPTLGGGPLLVVTEGDSVFEARAPAHQPGTGWRLRPAADRAETVFANEGETRVRARRGPPRRLTSEGGLRTLQVVQRAPDRDSVRILRPDGGEVASAGWDRILGAAWCGGTPPAVLLTVRDGDDFKVVHWAAESERISELEAPGLPGEILACSPDGRYGAMLTAADGAMQVVVLDLVSGARHAVPLEHSDAVTALRWASDRPVSVPIGLHIHVEGDLELDWGESDRLMGHIELSNGGRTERGIEWQSADPSVVSITSDGTVTANRPGDTWVRISHDGWMSDSIRVTVRETARAPRILLWDPLPPLTDDLWSGGPRGAEWHSVDGFELRSGATLEMEYRYDPETLVSEPLEACLLRSADGPRDEGLCVAILRQEGADRAATAELRFHTAFPGLPLDLPVPSRAGGERPWRHLSLGLLPDGTGVVHVDGREAGRAPVRLSMDDPRPWHLVLRGMEPKIEGTDPHRSFRNVLLWPDVRF